tara:strand:+ start:686 stop:1006 length:321 start_codon:yes stop_codon:yes gene_type:complete
LNIKLDSTEKEGGKKMTKRRNNLHSFTLWPKSSDIVSRIKDGRKSEFVSKAIIWYDTPPGELSRKMEARIEAHEQLMERFSEVCREREELKKSQSFISKMRNKWSK